MNALQFSELRVMICEGKIRELKNELKQWTDDMTEETQYNLFSQQLDNIPMIHIERYLRSKKLNNIK